MPTINIEISNSIMFNIQFKLSDFVLEFYRFSTYCDKIRNGCQSIDNSLFISTKKVKYILNQWGGTVKNFTDIDNYNHNITNLNIVL